MKLIHAYIQPHKLSEVTLALRPFCGFTVLEARGRGKHKPLGERRRTSDDISDFEKHVKLEICCPDGAVDQIVRIISSTAHTGLRGDGLVLVTPVDSALRISTGTGGDEAC